MTRADFTAALSTRSALGLKRERSEKDFPSTPLRAEVASACEPDAASLPNGVRADVRREALLGVSQTSTGSPRETVARTRCCSCAGSGA